MTPNAAPTRRSPSISRSRRLRPDGGVVRFDIEPHRKNCLLEGLDDIGLTLAKKDQIADFEQRAQARTSLGVSICHCRT